MRHWAVWAWLGTALVLSGLWLFATPAAQLAAEPLAVAEGAIPVAVAKAERETMTAADFGGRLLRMHLLVWSLCVLALGASAVSSESEEVGATVLCRGVSRWQYYVGKCVARSLTVAAVFLAATLLPLALATVRLPNDLTAAGTVHGLTRVGGLLVLLAVVGVAGGVWFRNALLAVACCWMAVYGAGLVATILDVEPLSPLSLAARLPLWLQGTLDLPQHSLILVLAVAAAVATVASATCFACKDV